MSAAVKPSEASLAALVLSAALHAAILLVPLGVAFRPDAPPTLPNSVAMPGNAIEVEAPTPELAAAPAAAPTSASEAPAQEAPTVDVKSLPSEAASEDAPPKPAPASKPRKPAAPKPKPAAKAAPSAAAASEPSVASTGQDRPTTGSPAAGSFGQEGLAPGVRRLGYAFTRAIPAASPADRAWRELPPGHVGTIRIELEVDENNRLGALKRWQGRPGEPAPPAVLERMVERTLILLRAGQFALSGSNSPGSERLTIDVSVRDEAADEEGADVVVQKKFEGASPGRPGKAYFRYGTGRAVELKVTISASGR